MLDKYYRIKCDRCNKYCIPVDSQTSFGCKDYEDPEPLDPEHFCKKCSILLYKEWLKKFKEGGTHGDWQKSNAEIKASKECELEWVSSSGYIDTRTNLNTMHRYIKKSEKEFYVPYLKFLSDPKNRELHKKAQTESLDQIPF